MPSKRGHSVIVYIEEALWTLLQEGVLSDMPKMSASTYLRNLMIADFKVRNILSPAVIDSLLTGLPVPEQTEKVA